jgi:S-layer protein
MSVFISDPYAIVQTAGETYIGNDTDQVYSINPNLIQAGDVVTIVDQGGANAIELPAGLEITESIASSNELVLTLSNGAIVNVRGADTFTFNVGQNLADGDTVGTEQSFADFAQNVLGVTVPAEGEAVAEGGAYTINNDGTADPTDPGTPGEASYSLTADAAAVDEGGTATFTLTTENVAEGTEVAYTISGVDADDVDGDLPGTAVVGADGTATIEVALTEDATTEGVETLTVSLDNGEATADVTVNDTSMTPVFTLAADADSVNEGETATFEITGAEANTEYAYKVTGDGAAAQIAAVTTDADGNATISVDASDVLSTDQAITVSIIGEDLTSTVTAVAVNDAPALTDAAATLADGVEDTAYTVDAADLLAGYTDEEGDAISVANLTADNDAAVVDNEDGTYTVTPVADFNGTVTLSYDVTDGTDSTAATQAVVFAAVNDAPTTTAATAAATEAGAAVEGQLVAEDVDGDELTFSLDAAVVEGLTLNADGSYSFDPSANTAVQALTYTDEPLDVVADYTVDDGNGETVQSTLTVTVDPTPLTFELQASTAIVEEGSAVEYTIVASEAVQADFTGEIQIALADGDTASLDDFGSGSFNPQAVTIATGETVSTVATITPTNDAVTEMPETFSATATVDAAGKTGAIDDAVADISTTVQDPSSVGGLGQTFNLTTDVDTIPGLVGSAGSTGTDGDDTIVGTVDGAASTFSALDSIDGGLGTDELKINDVATIAAGIDLSVATISNVETMTIQSVNNVASNATTGVLDTSSVTGLETLNVTKGDAVYVESADTTDINVSGASGLIDVAGGKDVTVTDATAGNAITVGDGAAGGDAAGAITITDTDNSGTNAISTEGGTDVTVTATVDATGADGGITVGDLTNGTATGDVSVTQNIESDGILLDNSDNYIEVNGGATVDVTVNGTITADEDGENNTLYPGDVFVNSDGNTTDVNITQNLTANDYSKAAIDDVPATQVLTFDALAEGETVIVEGLTFTASKALTAEEVAAAFANLGEDSGAGNVPTAGDIVSAGGPVTNGVYTGTFSDGTWTSSAADGANVTFTAAATTAAMTFNTGDITPDSEYDAGTDNSATAESGDASVAYGTVTVEDDAAASIENITVDGYSNSTIGAGTNADALKTLSLANSAGTMDVTTAAATLDLTVDDVNDAVTLNAGSLTDLTLNAVGGDSTFDLISANTTDLTIDAAADLDFSVGGTSDLTALVNATIEGAGAVTLDGQVAATLETIDAATNTGGVTASVNGDATAVTGGDGGDDITVLNADTAIDKDMALGAGDDRLDISDGGAVTAILPTVIIDGGADTDLLAMDSAAAAGADAAFASKFTNFEQLEIAEQVDISTASVTVDLSVLEYDHVVTNGTESGAVTTSDGSFVNALIFDNAANGSTFELNDAQVATGATGTDIGSIKINLDDATGGTDSLNLITNAVAGDVEAQDVETINVTGSNSVVLKDTDLTTVTVNGNHATAFDAEGNPTAYAIISVALDPTTTNVELVDASASMGALIFDSLDDTTATVINGGEGDDEISIAGSNDEVYAGAGNDRITIADTASASVVEGGEGNDLFDLTGATLGKEAYATINDFNTGDQIWINASSFKSQGVVVTDPAEMTLTDWFTAAFNQTVATEAIWFQHNDNTYIVDNTTTDDFVAGDDVIVKLTGMVDLDTASFNDFGGIGVIEMA